MAIQKRPAQYAPAGNNNYSSAPALLLPFEHVFAAVGGTGGNVAAQAALGAFAGAVAGLAGSSGVVAAGGLVLAVGALNWGFGLAVGGHRAAGIALPAAGYLGGARHVTTHGFLLRHTLELAPGVPLGLRHALGAAGVVGAVVAHHFAFGVVVAFGGLLVEAVQLGHVLGRGIAGQVVYLLHGGLKLLVKVHWSGW